MLHQSLKHHHDPKLLECKAVTIYPDEIEVQKNKPISTLLGSCVAICLYDPYLRIAGMNHYRKSYVQLMGGVFCKRKDLLIRPYYDVQADQQTGLIKTSWFDDLITLKLKGVLYLGKAIITRLHQWRLEQAGGRSSPLLGVL